MSRIRETFGNVPGIRIIDEPVDKWQRAGLLEAMYNKTLSANEFQLMALMSRVGPLLRAFYDKDVRLIITERSPWSDCHVFGAANFEAGSINHDNYLLTYSEVMSAFPVSLKCAFVLLDLPVDEAQKRINARNRKGETGNEADVASNGIPRAYMETLSTLHDRFAGQMREEKWPVWRVNAAVNATSVGDAIVSVVADVLAGCHEHEPTLLKQGGETTAYLLPTPLPVSPSSVCSATR